jgi:hypothetical protein
MWKGNLNRHFTNLLPSLKMSGFLIFWNILFHSMTLAILLFWSLTTAKINPETRLNSLNQFLNENQILFATLCCISALLFFKSEFIRELKLFRDTAPVLIRALIRGMGLGIMVTVALALHGTYPFLGVSTQINFNFLASYAWIFRAFLIFAFCFSSEFLLRNVLRRTIRDPRFQLPLEALTGLFIYWIWFGPTVSELFTLLLIFGLYYDLWVGIGFLSGWFIWLHAICGFNFFQNESQGLLQFKIPINQESLLQNSSIQLILGALLLMILIERKWKRNAH